MAAKGVGGGDVSDEGPGVAHFGWEGEATLRDWKDRRPGQETQPSSLRVCESLGALQNPLESGVRR